MNLVSSFFSSIKSPTVKELIKNNIPEHVAIIMDGNGRWALKRKLPRSAGHSEGAETLKEIIGVSIELGIKFLTVYSFSTENWQRPQDEIDFLFSLFVEKLGEELNSIQKNGIRVKLIGKREGVPDYVLEAFEDAEKKTSCNNKLILNIAFNYGGRQEIIEAIKKIHKEVLKKNIDIEKINEVNFGNFLYTGNCPDPDFLIRTGGEYRISNFLLWQIAYTEFYFVKTLWPDFDRSGFLKAIYYYQQRKRRFGRV
ncbi:MAG: isoprenyl transferase [Candidatus Humimicrobiaceae bacterium]|nr:isoprenyl transferase [Actinomycetota bacterium]MDD5600250.1 isoprenyl transferase [Actinomycetota bacterium]MDY0027610.1 isoprenyl transferase [Candidatus Humimicrobiaceae bacterium]